MLLGSLTGGEPVFIPVKIDGPVQDPANHSYWFGPFAEAVAVFDVNGDGRLDITCGKNWYENTGRSGPPALRPSSGSSTPTIATMPTSSDPSPTTGARGPWMSIATAIIDVIASGWMQMSGVYWYENPGKAGGKWKAHLIHKARNMEGFVLGDIAGHHNGDQDILINHWDPVPGQHFSGTSTSIRSPGWSNT